MRLFFHLFLQPSYPSSAIIKHTKFDICSASFQLIIKQQFLLKVTLLWLQSLPYFHNYW